MAGNITVAIVMLTCFLFTFSFAVYVLCLTWNQKSLRRLRQMTILMVFYELMVLLRAYSWYNDFDWYREAGTLQIIVKWLKVSLTTSSKLLLFWELSVMYHYTCV